ncbi:hypothetical protein NEOLI_003758 [Neolecta irregularis DAH-3]|uniref:Uncharacterized protein n=1 Tax=Neolecta irregularis (strain DAH-3) TaxID=1198029 RepID=A0A1U7LSL2_NEOID|nr:hypothetical protein NEOLI_003758 [Neolecta irregularis DAH-3]|eukprot:OLL25532.1 hypothetical protein NEOLI_003758 [Neolecta irregularis DAH-3]
MLTANVSSRDSFARYKRATWHDFRGRDGELDLKALYECDVPIPFIHAHYYGLESRLASAWERWEDATQRDLTLKKIRYASPLYRILKLSQLEKSCGLVVVSSNKGTPPIPSPSAVGSIYGLHRRISYDDSPTDSFSKQLPEEESFKSKGSGCRHFFWKLLGPLLSHNVYSTHFTRSVAHMLRVNIAWDTQQ